MKRSGMIQRKTPPVRRTRIARKSKTELALLKDELWTLCRQIVRKLYGNECYTCPKKDLEGSDWQTGHFIASSVCSTELRYSLRNLRIQCAGCNIWKSGNWLEFENHLIREVGEDEIKELKALNEKTKGLKYDILWYKAKIQEYKLILETL